MKKFNTNVLPIIGMSPGNSYFKQEIISKLIQEVLHKHNCVVIFIPDIPAISTYRAMGYSLSRARQKAISKGNNLKNKVYFALEQYAISNKSVYILDWGKDVETLSLYIKSYNRIVDLFQNNKKFHSSILNTTQSVLEKSGKNIIDIRIATLTGIHYILAELSFLEICPQLFNCKEVRYIYHKEWPVYQNYISGLFDNLQREHLTFEKISFM